jgi:hypothetical protein
MKQTPPDPGEAFVVADFVVADLVVAEVELLARLHTERITKEAAATFVAQVEAKQVGFGIEHRSGVVEPLEHVFHLIEMVGIGDRLGLVTLTGLLFVEGLEHFDLHDMTSLGVGIDRPFAEIARVVQHRKLRK